jgi:hypothetical protein
MIAWDTTGHPVIVCKRSAPDVTIFDQHQHSAVMVFRTE